MGVDSNIRLHSHTNWMFIAKEISTNRALGNLWLMIVAIWLKIFGEGMNWIGLDRLVMAPSGRPVPLPNLCLWEKSTVRD